MIEEPLNLETCVRVSPYDDRNWILVEDYEYVTHSVRPGMRIVVPAGFITDLASVPRVLWRHIAPFGRHTNAAVVHDYLYASRPHVLNKDEADVVFLEILQRDGVPESRQRMMYNAVRKFGYTAFFSSKHLAPTRDVIPTQERVGGLAGGRPGDHVASDLPPAHVGGEVAL